MFSSVLPCLFQVRLRCGAYLHLDASLQPQGVAHSEGAKRAFCLPVCLQNQDALQHLQLLPHE